MWKLSLLLCLSFVAGGCSTPLGLEIRGERCADHDVSSHWGHNPCDIDDFVKHLDDKINRIIECEDDVQCKKDIINI